MEEKPKLSNSLHNAMKMPEQVKQDASCKVIMKDRLFLACILKAVVSEYKDVSEEDIASKYIEPETIRDDIDVSKNLTNRNIIGSAEEDATINEGIVKYDVIFEAKAPVVLPKQKYVWKEPEKIIINLRIDVEAQNNYNPGYPISKRAAFYCARLLSSEFDGVAETMEYDKLYKVYSIWICFDVADYLANTITRFKVTKEDVLGMVDIPETDYNLMESIIIRLGTDSTLTGNRVIDFLNAIFGSEDQKMINSKLETLGFSGTSVMEEVNDMMSFSERTLERGMERGMERGIQEGVRQASYKFILKLHRKGMSVEDITEICDEFDEEQIRKIIAEEMV